MLQLQFQPGIQLKRSTVTVEGTFSGYGAVFGNRDTYGDVIAKGAFAESLRDWSKLGRLPPMLLQHGGVLGPAEDLTPVGIWDRMAEDDVGLMVEGRLIAIGTDKGKYLLEGMREGALDGLSIGYIPREIAYGQKPGDPARTLKKIELREVSIVTFPANEQARIASVKGGIESPRDLEDALRGLGFSSGEAKRIVAGGWKAYAKDSGTNELNGLAATLAAHTESLRNRT